MQRDIISNLCLYITLILLFSCSEISNDNNEQENLDPIHARWIYNLEELGDSIVSIGIEQIDRIEGRVNNNEWIDAIVTNNISILRFPISNFQNGDNVIEARTKSGNNRGPITSKIIKRGSYEVPDNGNTSFNATIKIGDIFANDVIVGVWNTKEVMNPDDDEVILVLTGDNGKITVTKLISIGSSHVISELYEINTIGQTISSTPNTTISVVHNLRKKEKG
ncbi:MAG: hypothetical protein ACP5Q5_10760 [Brevinematia bacterium]